MCNQDCITTSTSFKGQCIFPVFILMYLITELHFDTGTVNGTDMTILREFADVMAPKSHPILSTVSLNLETGLKWESC